MPLPFMFDALEQIFQERPQPPRASRQAIASLRRETVGTDDVAEDEMCSICRESFTVGEERLRMPCEHAYHEACISPWLENHNSCPDCRYELDTDDAHYNENLHARQAERDTALEERRRKVEREKEELQQALAEKQRQRKADAAAAAALRAAGKAQATKTLRRSSRKRRRPTRLCPGVPPTAPATALSSLETSPRSRRRRSRALRRSPRKRARFT